MIATQTTQKQSYTHRFTHRINSHNFKSIVRTASPDRLWRKEKAMVRDELSPSRAEQPIPDVGDIRRFDDDPSFGAEDAMNFSEYLLRVRKMLNDVIERDHIKM